MSGGCPGIWNVLHDAIIVRLSGAVPGDLRLEIDCDYLRDRFPSPGDRFFLTFRGCSRFAYSPWANESETIEDFEALAARRLWILSADPMDGWCKVHCNEAIVNGNGGTLEVAAADFELQLDDRTVVTLAELVEVAEEYWAEWSSSSGRQRD